MPGTTDTLIFFTGDVAWIATFLLGVLLSSALRLRFFPVSFPVSAIFILWSAYGALDAGRLLFKNVRNFGDQELFIANHIQLSAMAQSHTQQKQAA